MSNNKKVTDERMAAFLDIVEEFGGNYKRENSKLQRGMDRLEDEIIDLKKKNEALERKLEITNGFLEREKGLKDDLINKVKEMDYKVAQYREIAKSNNYVLWPLDDAIGKLQLARDLLGSAFDSEKNHSQQEVLG